MSGDLAVCIERVQAKGIKLNEIFDIYTFNRKHCHLRSLLIFFLLHLFGLPYKTKALKTPFNSLKMIRIFNFLFLKKYINKYLKRIHNQFNKTFLHN